MERERRLLTMLNDGQFHSGEALAAQLGGISRAAVWKLIRNLEALGVAIHAVQGRGYRLAEPMEFLDRGLILAELTDAARPWLAGIEIYQRIDSTNTYLMSRANDGLPGGSVCLAEWQATGRGRGGRSWVSPFAANLYLSLLWRFSTGPAVLMGLSLAVGVAVARALESVGVTDLGLKWPNDLVWRQRKLGGILLEFGGESSGPCHVVVGVGLNVAMPAQAGSAIDQPWVDLRSILGQGGVSRNRLAARVLDELVALLARFEQTGFTGLSEDWQRFDLAAGRPIVLKLPNAIISGIARGVDSSGALRVETAAGIQHFMAGEISLRLPE